MRNLFNKSSKHGDGKLGKFIEKVETALKNQTLGTALGAQVAALESWNNDTVAAEMVSAISGTEARIASFVQELGGVAAMESFGEGSNAMSTLGVDWVAEHQRRIASRAAAIAMHISSDVKGYRDNVNAAMESASRDRSAVNYCADYTNGERAGALGIGSTYAMEAFETTNLAQAMAYSVSYNLTAAIQDPAIEMLFKTVVMSPDQPTFFYEIAIDRYWDGALHDGKNKPARTFKKETVMDAIRHPDRLHRDVLNVVPFFQEKGEGQNTDLFMPKELRNPVTRTVAGIDIPTQPLIVGTEYDLLSLSMHPGLGNGGIFDETDTLDSAIGVDTIYLSLKTGEAKEGGLIAFPLAGLERRNFTKSVQGHGQEMDLNFVSSEFVLDGTTLSVEGTQPDLLKQLTTAGYALRVQVELRGTANTETGYYRIQHSEAKVVGAVKIDKGTEGKKDTITKVDINESAVKAEIAKFKLAVKYFDPEANRTNSNLRTMGMLLDRDVYTAKFAIGIRAPIRYQRKVGSNESSQDIIESLVRFAQTRQSADGWYELFRYRDTLKRYADSPLRDEDRIPDYMGVAKYMVKPYYRYVELDIAKMVKTQDSKEALDNAREYMVGVLQELASDMLVQSNWLIAATRQNNNMEVTPHFGIVCGQYLPLLLSVRGDLRLLGANFDSTIKTTFNSAMDETLFITLVDPKADGLQPLGFGNTFYYAENIITVSPHTTNGSIKETFVVQQRYQHVAHLPILGEIRVKGLPEYVSRYNLFRVAVDQNNVPAAAGAAGVGGAGAIPGIGG